MNNYGVPPRKIKTKTYEILQQQMMPNKLGRTVWHFKVNGEWMCIEDMVELNPDITDKILESRIRRIRHEEGSCYTLWDAIHMKRATKPGISPEKPITLDDLCNWPAGSLAHTVR